MRISTNTIYDAGLTRMSDGQAKLLKIQQQVASGQRILSPADDPVGAARALNLTQGQELNNQFSVNRQNARNALLQEENVLQQVTNLIHDVKTSVVQAGNPVLNDEQRRYIAVDLQTRFEELLGMANTRDGIGNYLFGGYQITTQPFTDTANGVRFNGDQGKVMLQVDSARQMATTDSGVTIFEDIKSAGTSDKQSIFTTLKDVIALLQSPGSGTEGNTNLTHGLGIANANFTYALDNVLEVRASVGARLKELDLLDETGDARNLQYAQSLSEIQDLDYNKALSELAIRQTILEASQKSFAKVTGLSLFALL